MIPTISQTHDADNAILERASKASFGLDHYPFAIDFRPEVSVETSRYWMQLFNHNRDGVWKGMLKIDLGTPVEDATDRPAAELEGLFHEAMARHYDSEDEARRDDATIFTGRSIAGRSMPLR